MTKTSLFKFITTHCQRLVSWETIGQKFDRKVLGNGLYKQEISESFPFFLRGGSWFGYLHLCFVLVKVKETMGIERGTSPCFNVVFEIELQNALGDLYWCKLSWFWVSSLHYVFVCSSVLSLLPFLGFPWPCQFMAICLKVWHSAFYRLGHLTWHTWSLGGKWVCECEMAYVGAWMWLCPAGSACLDLIGLPRCIYIIWLGLKPQ